MVSQHLLSRVFHNGIDNVTEEDQYTYYRSLIMYHTDIPLVIAEDIVECLVLQAWIPLTIRTYTKCFGVMVKALMPISSVKDIVSAESGISSEEIILNFRGSPMRNELTLSQYGVIENSVINLTV